MQYNVSHSAVIMFVYIISHFNPEEGISNNDSMNLIEQQKVLEGKSLKLFDTVALTLLL